MDDSGELGLWVLALGGLANLAIGTWLWRLRGRGPVGSAARPLSAIFLLTGAFAVLVAAVRHWLI